MEGQDGTYRPVYVVREYMDSTNSDCMTIVGWKNSDRYRQCNYSTRLSNWMQQSLEKYYAQSYWQ